MPPLSYAVTQSTQGSGASAGEETLSLKVTELMSQINSWQQAYRRLKINGSYDQVYFGNEAPNTNGQCHYPSVGAPESPCSTIGLFHQGNGLPFPYVPTELLNDDVSSSEQILEMSYRGTELNNKDMGTSNSDPYIMISDINEEACVALNGDETINSFSYAFSVNRAEWKFPRKANGSYPSIAVSSGGKMLIDNEGCLRKEATSDDYRFVYMLDAF